MKLSIVGELINSNQIKITDEQGIPVSLCSPSNFKFNYPFRIPSIIIDNFEREKYKNVEIKRIGVEELDKFGYRLVSIAFSRGMTRNYPRQVRFYTLENKKNPSPHDANSEILYKLPDNHFIEFDFENKRLRISGKNAYGYIRSENASRWIQLETKR